jgi:hypothetical protein
MQSCLDHDLVLFRTSEALPARYSTQAAWYATFSSLNALSAFRSECLVHPLHQVPKHVEVPYSCLSFSSGCFLDPPYFNVQCMAMDLNHVRIAIVKCPAQLLSNAENVKVQLGFLECFVDNCYLNLLSECTVGV